MRKDDRVCEVGLDRLCGYLSMSCHQLTGVRRLASAFAVASVSTAALLCDGSGGSSSDGAPPKARTALFDLVGNTPLIELTSLSKATGRRIVAKAEHLNPSGSVKDR